jgi:hypothetical protein
MEPLVLNSGRNIKLMYLKQELYGEEWVMGYPTRESNRQYMDAYLKETREDYGVTVHLIKPVETPTAHPESYSFLPSVVCTARFRSLRPVADQTKDVSMLVVIWFQEQFALPIDPEIEAQLKALDWESLATDIEL